ncbi:MAG: hypothetical protein Q4B42_05280 [Oscillospiraceae bacterium]|nr:hypothetical protein [Oscillospiraceae bacterium]
MKEHKYLETHKNAKIMAIVLAVTSAPLLVGGALTAGYAHSLLSKLLLVLGACASIALACFVMHYLRYNEGSAKAKAAVSALHFCALHAVFTAATLFSGGFGSFSYGVLHAVCDGLLAALLLSMIMGLFKKTSWPLSVMLGVAVLCVSLLAGDIWTSWVLLALAAVLAVCALLKMGREPGLGIYSAILSVICAVLIVCALVNGGEAGHMWLHFGVLFAGLAAAIFVFVLQPRKVKRSVDVNECESEAVKTVQTSADEAENDSYDREKWIVKKYHKLSPEELLLAPVDALYGLSETDAELLKSAFGIKTIGELADNKFFAWAEEIVKEAEN